MKKLIIILLFLIIFWPKNAFASSLNLTVSPSVISVRTGNSDEITQDIHIKNNSDHNISYVITMLPFIPSPLGNGEPIIQESVNKDYNTLFHSIDLLDNNLPTNRIDLAQGQETILKLVLHPSQQISSSDYYFSILFTSDQEEPSGGSGVKINQASAINVLLSYGKQSEASGAIKEFSAPSFADKGPVEFNVSVSNTSKNFITPQGNIQIKNMFGQTVGSLELKSINVLSDSDRFFDKPTWNEKFLFGFYSAKLQVALSPSGPAITKELRFLAFPFQYLAITLLVLLFIFYLGLRTIKKRSEK